MTTTAEATVEVATVDLRRAFDAVKPHAEKNKTGDNAVEHRIRLSFDKDEVFVMATNGQTTGLAAVPIQSDSRAERFASDDGRFWVDISPRHVGLILQHFPISTGSGGELHEMLSLRATTSELVVTDSGGLFAGESVTFQQLDWAQDYPGVLDIMATALAGVGETTTGKKLVASGELLSLFKAATTAYDQPLEVKATGSSESRGFIVACGDRFVGHIESRHNDDDGMKRRQSAHTKWLQRLPAKQKLAAV